ncbi:hypothetical protein V8C34DRAFT_267683 [Trichoderma compactum]
MAEQRTDVHGHCLLPFCTERMGVNGGLADSFAASLPWRRILVSSHTVALETGTAVRLWI